jgi:predicted N-acyltransferase
MGDSDRPTFVARAFGAIDEVPPGDWDACAGADNPFVSHAFLAALEGSGSASTEQGWAPHHIVVEDAAGRVAGAVPMYLKSHSYGEYVFDHGWADAFERAGGHYYPKLQVSVPFTPVTGPRLLVRPGADEPRVTDALIAGCLDLARRAEVSSLHVTFPTEPEWRRLGEAGFLLRTSRQFQWTNRGYQCFDDFLAQLASRKRKAVRRERRDALGTGITVETLTGNSIKPKHWDAFFECYIATSDRKWGIPYLSRAFFQRLGETLADRVVLVLAAHDGRYVAGALNLRGANTLYGRNWGCLEHHPFLHFELCYYRAIDFAIAHGLERVEAGAQGTHKIARGYLPELTYSAHWIAHGSLRDAVARFLEHERRGIEAEMAAFGDYSPFRRDEGR